MAPAALQKSKRQSVVGVAPWWSSPAIYLTVGILLGVLGSRLIVTVHVLNDHPPGAASRPNRGKGAPVILGRGPGGSGSGGGGGAADDVLAGIPSIGAGADARGGSGVSTGSSSSSTSESSSSGNKIGSSSMSSPRIPVAANGTAETNGTAGTINGGRGAKRRAYVFYAAAINYMCSALVNIKRLKDLQADPSIEIVIILPDNFTPELRHEAAARRLGVRLFRAPSLIGPTLGGYYQDCMAKLYVFNMTEYERVVFMDSDCIILKNMDWLFGVPEADLSAPRAYWLDPGVLKPGCGSTTWKANDGPQVGLQMKFTSAVMVVNPSTRLWTRIWDRYFPGGKPKLDVGMYDMDLLNIEFKDEAVLLRGETIMILSLHYAMAAVDPLQYPFKSRVSRDELYEMAGVVHFSPTKPWTVTSRQSRPGAHERFYQAHELWTNVSKQVCG